MSCDCNRCARLICNELKALSEKWLQQLEFPSPAAAWLKGAYGGCGSNGASTVHSAARRSNPLRPFDEGSNVVPLWSFLSHSGEWRQNWLGCLAIPGQDLWICSVCQGV